MHGRCRRAVIASSTSAILPSKFTEHLQGRHRCLVVHPINPPYLIPAAEVVPAPWTSPEVVERTRAFLVAAGHAPLVMKRELDGFIMNRMQGALLEEAFRLVADGYATVEDVDIGIRDGLALRWSFMGPFETIDLNAPGGVRDYVERYQIIYATLFPQMQRRVDWAGEVLETVEADRRERLPQEELGERQVWRDRRLMALAAHKKKSDAGVRTMSETTELQAVRADQGQSHHHLRGHRRDPHAVDVALSADHAGRDRRPRRSRRRRRARRSCISMRATRRPASPTRRRRPSPASCRASSSAPMPPSTSPPAAAPT